MTGLQRFRANVRNLFRSHRPHDLNKKHDDDEGPDMEDGVRARQYRLAATRKVSITGAVSCLCVPINFVLKVHFTMQYVSIMNDELKSKKTARRKRLLSWLTCWCLFRSGDADVRIQNRNSTLSKYLHFAFKVSFVSLFALMCLLFFALAAFFAGLIFLAGVLDKECVRAGSGSFGSDGSRFAEAFSLSWTTLSTVGYGSTYPALGYQNHNPSHCLFINMICLMEAFVGVLYSGFCGAILFGKVVRIQSHAHVIFSDPMVIRYGSGVEEDTEMDGHPEDDKENSQNPNKDESQHDNVVNEDTPLAAASVHKRKKVPLPVLEFRIVNKLFGQPGGEIMDASLTVVANIDARDADSTAHANYTDSDFRWHSREESNETSWGEQDPNEQNLFWGSSTHSTSSAGQRPGSWQNMPKFLDPLATIHAAALRQLHLGNRDHQTVDEDPSARLVSKRIFSKMLIEASEHPFFKRVWLVRHVLDENSPILKPSARRRIWRNGGYWPEKLNNYYGIRNSLQFNQILVSLNGVSNVSAASVYAQKIYDAVDVTIGFRFVNIMYTDSEGELKVDTDLINDVREQNGGGGEPLYLDDEG